jgi:hypothetical protein
MMDGELDFWGESEKITPTYTANENPVKENALVGHSQKLTLLDYLNKIYEETGEIPLF